MTKQSSLAAVPGDSSGAGAPLLKKDSTGCGPYSVPAAASVLRKAFDPSEEDSALMVAAGAAVLWESGLIEESRGLVESVVSEIFLAMLEARSEAVG